MKREREDIEYDTSPSETKHVRCRDINIPLDLMVEILKKLPAKSLVRFQCISKELSSIIGSRRDFIDSIVTRSLTQPPRDSHLIFHECIHIDIPWIYDFYMVSSTQNTDKVVLSVPRRGDLCAYVRGLTLWWWPDYSYDRPPVIYNPTTRQFLSLPEMMKSEDFFLVFIGYEPFENQYKVLCLCVGKDIGLVFTLGDPIKEWRNVQYNIDDFRIEPPAVCINGIIYFRDVKVYDGNSVQIMSFDVRSEKFYQCEALKLPNGHRSSTLINYHGKLGYICCYINSIGIWVMEEAEEKQEWSKVIFYEMEGFKRWCIAGATRYGEIVFTEGSVQFHQTFYLYYYDPKRNSLRRRAADQGITLDDTKYKHKPLVFRSVILDHVENTMRL